MQNTALVIVYTFKISWYLMPLAPKIKEYMKKIENNESDCIPIINETNKNKNKTIFIRGVYFSITENR